MHFLSPTKSSIESTHHKHDTNKGTKTTATVRLRNTKKKKKKCIPIHIFRVAGLLQKAEAIPHPCWEALHSFPFLLPTSLVKKNDDEWVASAVQWSQAPYPTPFHTLLVSLRRCVPVTPLHCRFRTLPPLRCLPIAMGWIGDYQRTVPRERACRVQPLPIPVG